uniref:G-protein subunit alpha 1 n=1 Tax=Hirondellea gigas TaxID=1518452 RepID=A0A2P2I7K2_9CRUS
MGATCAKVEWVWPIDHPRANVVQQPKHPVHPPPTHQVAPAPALQVACRVPPQSLVSSGASNVELKYDSDSEMKRIRRAKRHAKPRRRKPYSGAARYKLLLLGSGESGKSTFFKRMLMRYGKGYTETQRIAYIDAIHENTIDSMQTLIYESKNSTDEYCLIDETCDEAAEHVEKQYPDARLTKPIATSIHKLWGDEGIQTTYENRAEFQVPDGAAYFFEDVHRIARRGYIPSQQDILRCRERTIGIQKEVLHLESDGMNAEFDIYDVGGQRGERNKWVQVFRDVHAVLFLVAISEFDMELFEDNVTNRLQDSIDVFKMVSNSKHFADVPIVLLFNKIDLFIEKLEGGVKFEYDGYDGPQDYDSITGFIQELFEREGRSDSEIITRFICAIDESFNADDILTLVIAGN